MPLQRMRGPLAAALRNDLCGAVTDARRLSSRRGIGGESGVGMCRQAQQTYLSIYLVLLARCRRRVPLMDALP